MTDTGKTQEALEVCNHAVELNQDNPFLHDTMVNLSDSLGKYGEDIENFTSHWISIFMMLIVGAIGLIHCMT
ncbi:hypothetical protein [Candidatus Nitrosocosmicus hydrocola]|uniref:hypothetical protein n=1 Tax=Candidatus Nitrosocosmicus hydrocola TaxID=1826872 RepID=UPI0011E59435|nr:hypothetical protein [Candidatus Nitrosocosmicus hydrocola]